MHLVSEPPVSPGLPRVDLDSLPAPERSLSYRHPVSPAGATAEQRKVVVRLAGGDQILIGTAADRDRALELARTTIARLLAEEGEWPFVGDRFLRPDAIVSVDVLRLS